MKYLHDILSVTVKSAGIFDAGDLVGFDGAKVTTADAAVLGIAKHPATEIGQDIAVIAIGMSQATAAGAIAAGQKVVSAAGGGVQAAGGSPANVLGTALIDAGLGQKVTILLRGAGQVAPNATASFSSLALGATVITIAVPPGATFNSVTGATFNGSSVTLGGTGASRSYTSAVPGTLAFVINWTDAGGIARTTAISQGLGLALSFTVSPAAPQVGDTVELQFNIEPETVTILMGSTPLAVTGSDLTYYFTATAEGVVDVTATRSGYASASGSVTITTAGSVTGPVELPVTPTARWSAEHSAITLDGSGLVVGATDLQGTYPLVAPATSGPVPLTDKAGQKYWRCAGGAYLPAHESLLMANRTCTIFFVGRRHRESATTFVTLGRQDLGTVPSVGLALQATTTSDRAPYLTAFNRNPSTQSAAADFVVGSQLQVLGVNAGGGSAYLHLNRKRSTNVSTASTSTTGIAGLEIGRGACDIYEVVVYNYALTEAEANAVAAALSDAYGSVAQMG